MFSASIYAAHSVFCSYLNMPTTVKIWHFMIRRIGDCALSSALFSRTILLLYDVTRGSPDDEFQEYCYAIIYYRHHRNRRLCAFPKSNWLPWPRLLRYRKKRSRSIICTWNTFIRWKDCENRSSRSCDNCAPRNHFKNRIKRKRK